MHALGHCHVGIENDPKQYITKQFSKISLYLVALRSVLTEMTKVDKLGH